MKVPFRLQASEYDCVPTTILNALSYLYDREDIPPLAIQRVFMYCLDSVSLRKNHGHGTTAYAVQLFGNWLNEFQEKKFRTSATYICGADVHLSNNNKIARTINAKGVALLKVKTSGASWHYILALSIDEFWLHAFDPYPPQRRVSKIDKYAFISGARGQSPNLMIHRSWIDTLSNKESFRFGIQSEREALLLERTEA